MRMGGGAPGVMGPVIVAQTVKASGGLLTNEDPLNYFGRWAEELKRDTRSFLLAPPATVSDPTNPPSMSPASPASAEQNYQPGNGSNAKFALVAP